MHTKDMERRGREAGRIIASANPVLTEDCFYGTPEVAQIPPEVRETIERQVQHREFIFWQKVKRLSYNPATVALVRRALYAEVRMILAEAQAQMQSQLLAKATPVIDVLSAHIEVNEILDEFHPALDDEVLAAGIVARMVDLFGYYEEDGDDDTDGEAAQTDGPDGPGVRGGVSGAGSVLPGTGSEEGGQAAGGRTVDPEPAPQEGADNSERRDPPGVPDGSGQGVSP